ncbi:hypothetical protein K7X08_036123 [Anisodus acutangulus]|uniref:Cytochrome b561 domain-containing protein n=1 Tax=Anisodus acutangulus TaxID=402998 RepID=A0A9Q1QWK3_9SOLA|nr:hypothetical protein K7X08_036123 [Anisodus acutangulus]
MQNPNPSGGQQILQVLQRATKANATQDATKQSLEPPTAVTREHFPQLGVQGIQNPNPVEGKNWANLFVGVILGLTGVAVGIQLNNKLQPHIPGHQGIGILIFVLSILQVLAFFVRTDKDSKYRKYWNLYHSWMGIALFFGAVNIVSGMHYEGAGQGWKIGYGFVLGSTMLACIILETLLRLKKLDDPTLCLSERLLDT